MIDDAALHPTRQNGLSHAKRLSEPRPTLADVRVRIHRGANEVGGSCIELESAGERLVLDLGRPLWATRDELVPVPPVPGIERHDPSLRALVISHPHLDHYGLATSVPCPVIMGEAAHRILTESAFFTGGVVPPAPTWFLRHREPIEIGPFTITPYLNDHSAFDAYSMVIEAEGRRVFYTGDIRGHGRKARLFQELLRSPPRADVLLMEGTHVRQASDVSARRSSERDIEASVAALSHETTGMVLAAFSPQNIDRLVTLFRAALRSGRELVLDL